MGESTRPDVVGVARPTGQRLGFGVLAVAAALALALLRPFSDWTPSDGYPVAFGAFLNVLPVCMLPTAGLILLVRRQELPAFADTIFDPSENYWRWPAGWAYAFVGATLLPTMGVAGQDYANAALVFVLVWVSFGSFMVIRVRRMNAATRRGMPADEEVERLAFRSEWLGMWAPPTCLVVYFAAVGELGPFPEAIRYPIAMVVLAFAFATSYLDWPPRDHRWFNWVVSIVWFGSLALTYIASPAVELALALVCAIPVPIGVEVVRRRTLSRRLAELGASASA